MKIVLSATPKEWSAFVADKSEQAVEVSLESAVFWNGPDGLSRRVDVMQSQILPANSEQPRRLLLIIRKDTQ